LHGVSLVRFSLRSLVDDLWSGGHIASGYGTYVSHGGLRFAVLQKIAARQQSLRRVGCGGRTEPKPGALTSLARRSEATISVLSRWLKQPSSRLSFDQIIDICGTEGLNLSALLQGRIEISDQGGMSVSPRRTKRLVRAADHAAIKSALMAAVGQGESVTAVAERLRVDIGTLAQHADLYNVVRQATRDRLAAAKAARQNEAIASAEAIAKKLLGQGRRLTSRNAKKYGTNFYPSDVGWAVMALIRVGLGDRSLKRPALASRMGQPFLDKIEAAVGRVRVSLGDSQQRLLLD